MTERYIYNLTKSVFIRRQREKWKTWDDLCKVLNPLTNELTTFGELSFNAFGAVALPNIIAYGKVLTDILEGNKNDKKGTH